MTCSQLEPEQIAQCLADRGSTGPRISFSTLRLEDLAGIGEITRFQVILFNPPSYFFVRYADLSSPAASGVYTGDASGALDIQQSPLFQFFQKVVLPLSSPPAAKRFAPGQALNGGRWNLIPCPKNADGPLTPPICWKRGSASRLTRRKEIPKNSTLTPPS